MIGYDDIIARRVYYNYKGITSESFHCENIECKKPFDVANLIIYHLLPIEISPSLLYDPRNMMLLCTNCYKKAKTSIKEKELSKQLGQKENQITQLQEEKIGFTAIRNALEKSNISMHKKLENLEFILMKIKKSNNKIDFHQVNCICCQDNITSKDYTYHDGEIYCPKCFLENYTVNIKGQVVLKDDSTMKKRYLTSKQLMK